VLVTLGGFSFLGHNRPAAGSCDGSEACRRDCARICVHAEQAALLAAGEHALGAEVYHSKVSDHGVMVPKGTPGCIECSKLLLAAGVAGVWLLTEAGWRRWTAEEFHAATVANLGLLVAPTPPARERAADGDEQVRPARFVDGCAEYVDDMRDGCKLVIHCDDQGDVYVSVILEGHRFGSCVRLCASGGAASAAPGLLKAMRQAHDAIKAAAEGRADVGAAVRGLVVAAGACMNFCAPNVHDRPELRDAKAKALANLRAALAAVGEVGRG
jgi:hypothetical protein